MAFVSDSRRWVRSLSAHFLVLALTCSSIFPQKVVDKIVATVSDGFRTELITLSDLRWQIALQPGSARPPFTSEDLNAALRKLIDQRTFSLEAKRLPRNQVSKSEIDAEINRIMEGVSAAQFESKLREVGFATVSDPEFQRIIEERLAIEKYLTFRFRSFIVVTPKEEETYYRDVWVPEFRRKYPDLMVPTLEQKRANIHDILVEQRVEMDMQAFLDNAKQRVTVVIVSPV